jgi:hypothetical protein
MPMSREHIRFLLGEMSLSAADLEVLATQLTVARSGRSGLSSAGLASSAAEGCSVA